ncbi:MAG: autotransporter domain-containing protein [Desulfobacterales bacterium]|nr:autotransporter domain-containing protein [Desulfobacterales bacterium]
MSGLLKNPGGNQLALGQGGADKLILQPTGHLWVVGTDVLPAIEFRGGNDEFIINGGTLDLPNPVDFGDGNDRLELNATPTGTARMLGGSGADTVRLNNSGSYSLTALASGWEQLEMNGAAWTLSGFTANTFSGGVALNAGNLTLDITGGDTTISGAVSGAGSLTKTGSGILTLTGTNTYSGGTTVSGGTLQGNTTSLQGNITNNAAVVFDQGAAGTYAGVMSGTGSLTKSGAGVLTLSGSNTYNGGTTVSAGTLQGTATSLQGDITNNAAVVFDQGAAGTYAGVISGTGTLAKNGAGVLTLSGANTYSGLTTINAGSLAVNGSLAGPVTVGAAGTLSGSGTVGNVTINGNLAPGNSIGTINTGNIAFNAGSVYTVEVDAAGNSDRTNVTGTVSLGNATLSVLAESGSYGLATDYLIIDNDGGDAVTGNFGTLTSNLAFLDPSVNYAGGDGNDVILTMTRNTVPFTNVATTPNEAAVAAALEQMVPGASGDTQTVLTALMGLSAPQACRAFNEMGVASNAAFFDTGIAGMTRYLQTMTARMGALRAGGGSGSPLFSAGPVYLAAADTGTVSYAESTLFALGNASPLTPDKNWGVWGRGNGMWGSRSGDDVASQYDYSMGGFTLGMDSRISDQFIAGFSAGYAHTKLDFNHLAHNGRSDSYQAAVYADYTDGPWYADTILSYAANGYETTRTITVGSLTRTAKGDFNGRELAAYFEGGYTVARNDVFIRPLAALQLTHIILDDYTETGAGALNLTVGRRTVDSYQGSVGLRVSRPLKTSDDLRLSPEARLRWAHEFSDDDRAVNAGFAGVPGASFVVTGDQPVRDSAILGLGLNALYKKDLNFYFNYDVSASRDHIGHALVGGLRYMWE